ncbi:MAG: hypothetical protein P8O79_08060 [Halieaceae bacterium]|nr:hypothetical protein [Halieaceae bacterium]
MSTDNPRFEVSLQLIDGFRFLVDFRDFGQLVTDEPAPLGEGKGPIPPNFWRHPSQIAWRQA